MTIAITAAGGHLGRLVVEDLLARGVPAGQIRAIVRTPEKVQDFADRGVQVVRGDYADVPGLTEALRGADKWVFISSSGSDEDRLSQHLTAIQAGKAAGVPHVVYTSIPKAETNPISFASVHKETEAAIKESGLPHTFLRNNWYWENLTASLPNAIEHGAIIGAVGEGLTAFAARADYAAAAAVVATTEGHEGKIYELTGDRAYSYAEIAAEISRQTGKEIAAVNLDPEEYRKTLAGFGLPDFLSAGLAHADSKIAEGALADVTSDLSTLIGRPTTTVAEAITDALKA
ncbi:NmrA family protein [Catenulispora acidiphila DSM 44928]|uniref:NmrA family protein n=1 Tax=Catenulispora acidiphila (strain DSM 44928 / JCM 14897 / NBRC 102108 / NRRL B-24433 / ID139908) TaxID=479433 RepID=C7QFP1_CATAD|nr:SDR family oxidoreductase [Catenulispora acidiphila]ACU68980.1 NmrA family protein [Catenulispora acidiphila DSM 44928]